MDMTSALACLVFPTDQEVTTTAVGLKRVVTINLIKVILMPDKHHQYFRMTALVAAPQAQTTEVQTQAQTQTQTAPEPQTQTQTQPTLIHPNSITKGSRSFW